MYFRNAIASLGALAMVSAAPATDSLNRRSLLASACSNAVEGLSQSACKTLASIGFLQQGKNSKTNNGVMWIGNDGANTFTFTNGGDQEATVVGWNMPPGTYTGMDLNVSPGQITYTLEKGKSVTISIANGISGSFSGLYQDTKLVNGQVSETWLEFTTGSGATVDVSREVNMSGKPISAVVKGSGCKTNMDTCVFKCSNGQNTCGEAGTYALDSCANGSQNGASYGTYGGQPSGGCQGFSNGGHVDVVLNGDGSSVPSGGNSGSSGSQSGPSSAPAAAPSSSPAKSNPSPSSVAPPAAPTGHERPSPSPTRVAQNPPVNKQEASPAAQTPTPTPASSDSSLAVVADPNGGGPLRELSEAAVKSSRQ